MGDVKLKWYDYHPTQGEKDCLCSFCGVLVEHWEPSFLIWTDDTSFLIVLHLACYKALNDAGYLSND
jgi:hypothetical protein